MKYIVLILAAFSVLNSITANERRLADSVAPATARQVVDNKLKGTLENNLYQLKVYNNGTLEIFSKKHRVKQLFNPHFTVIYSDSPIKISQGNYKELNYVLPSWKTSDSDSQSSYDFFSAGEKMAIFASEVNFSNRKIGWIFPENDRFTLSAEITLEQNGEPLVTFTFIPKIAASYSVGYTGVPEVQQAGVEELWQPLIWQERRFPSRSFLSMEYACPLPAVTVKAAGVTTSLVADPSEVPFRLPTFKNSRFGVLLRNDKGNAQPMIFAPVLGLPASNLEKNTAFSFSFRLLTLKGDCHASYRYIAENIYKFKDYRENVALSLNKTIENFIDFALNDYYSGWMPEYKAFNYINDVKGAVKLVSSLHPFSIALITDNQDIFTRRTLPMIEYLMSREKYLFGFDPDAKGQHASHSLKGPTAEVSELATLYSLSGNRNTVFKYYAETLFGKRRALNLRMASDSASWQSSLALYRMTSEKKYFDKAVGGANEYIDQRVLSTQNNFKDARIAGGGGGQFWTDFAPKWMDLLEIYEETRDLKYLNAAVEGAKTYSEYVWLQPAIPVGNIIVHKGDTATIGGNQRNKISRVPMIAAEQAIPAWQVSQIGLTPEATNTFHVNPAVFLTHYAAYMLRLAHYTGDAFFKNIARSAVVGRYANYPGYTMNTEYVSIYSRPDFPLRGFQEITYTDVFYNHVWPHIALLMDYLVTDAIYKSAGKIDFPSQNAQGYAYLQSKVYGDRPGKFYGDENVKLWMPQKMIDIADPQINYVSGYGNNNLYIAFLNQSNRASRTKIALNPGVVSYNCHVDYKVNVWKDNRPDKAIALKGGSLELDISGGGITAISIEGLKVIPQFQDKINDGRNKPLSDQSFKITKSAFGEVTGMLFSWGKSFNSAYIWLQADKKMLKEASLYYKQGNNWETVDDRDYPYEFTIPVSPADPYFEFRIEGVTHTGLKVKSETVRLTR
ncbi:hypothetical protein [Chitinophaga barathri]|uniref:Uncharacterized protein n=1 Tax=Chitinophaga barathri TaxID=1647451 RepID=A0A3N4MHT6_9BACT|nr:hypothetical protein [Chitinophaga barathri]RPD42995.1 hypothetical protein EG028_01515 [Chitinophaga barathri]